MKVTINGEEVIIEGAGVEQLTLKAGDYKVAAVKDGAPVSQQLVTITRGRKQVVRITMEGVATPLIPAPEGNAIVADRQMAEWVLSVGGSVNLIRPDRSQVDLRAGPLPAEPFSLFAVSIGNNLAVRDDDLARLSRCRYLENVYLTGTSLTGSGLQHLKSVPKLGALMFVSQRDSRGNPEQATDEALAPLAELRGLHYLDLSSNLALTDACLDHLAALTELRTLLLNGCSITDSGLQKLDSLKQITGLHLSETKGVTDAGVAHFLRSHPHLTDIDILNADSTQRRTLEPLANATELSRIGLSAAQMTAAGLDALKRLAKLRRIDIDWATDETIARVVQLPQLSELNLHWSNGYSSGGFPGYQAKSFELLAAHPKLETLLLGESLQATDEDLQILAKTPRLKSLTLSFGNRKYTPAGIEKFHALRPEVKLTVDGKTYEASPQAVSAPKPAIAPFDSDQAKQHQEAWAKHLGVPVEYKNSIGMKFRLIPPGEFLMGSPEGEIGGSRDEREHLVELTKPFLLGTHEVTQAEFEQVMQTNPSFFTKQDGEREDLAAFDTSRFPVEQVTWFDAVEFCNKLSARNGLTPYYQLKNLATQEGKVITPSEVEAVRGHSFRYHLKPNEGLSIGWAEVVLLRGTGYRLATEAEWEFACRAGTTSAFHFGNMSDGRKANVIGTTQQGTAVIGPNLKRPAEVGSYAANGFGLHDMHGNVLEWCQDWYDAKLSDTRDPQGPASGQLRSARGGSWAEPPAATRSAYRLGASSPGTCSDFAGFRVVLSVEAVKLMQSAASADSLKPAAEAGP